VPHSKIILGPPGTGKTHNLLNLVEQELARGTPPDKIAFVAFTKKAANEARDRAMEKFNLEEQHLPYFRTLHSLKAHRRIGLRLLRSPRRRRTRLVTGQWRSLTWKSSIFLTSGHCIPLRFISLE